MMPFEECKPCPFNHPRYDCTYPRCGLHKEYIDIIRNEDRERRRQERDKQGCLKCGNNPDHGELKIVIDKNGYIVYKCTKCDYIRRFDNGNKA